MKSTDVLVAEHNAVLLALEILKRIEFELAAEADRVSEDLEQLIDFFRGFVDRCHHGKEEDVLFPLLEKRGVLREGGPIGVLLAEHDRGRRHIQAISEALARLRRGDSDAAGDIRNNAGEYRSLLRAHIDKENQVLYPMADRLCGEDDDTSMVEQFEKIEQDRVGVGKHEAYHDMLHRLKKAYKA